LERKIKMKYKSIDEETEESMEEAVSKRRRRILEDFDPDPYKAPELKLLSYIHSLYDTQLRKETDSTKAVVLNTVFDAALRLATTEAGSRDHTFARGMLFSSGFIAMNLGYKEEAHKYLELHFFHKEEEEEF
jgi:hypothetical protein